MEKMENSFRSIPTNTTSANHQPIKHTQDPIVTGTSVLAVRYADGIAMTADTLASYGSLARFRTEERIKSLGNNMMIGAAGDLSDFQWMMKHLDEVKTSDDIIGDGHTLSPHAIHSYITRIMYQRRNKFDPLWNYFVIAGFKDGKPELGVTDLRGGSFSDNTIGIGYGNFIAQPLLRKAWKPDMTKQEAKQLLENCMRVLYYRDARSYNRMQFATVDKDGVHISQPYELETDWSCGVIKYTSDIKEF